MVKLIRIIREFSPSRGDKLFTYEETKGYLEEYNQSGTFNRRLVTDAESLGISPLRLLNSQLRANRVATIQPQLKKSSSQSIQQGNISGGNGISGANMIMSYGVPAKGAAYLAGNVQQESGWYGQRAYWDDVGAPAGGLVS